VRTHRDMSFKLRSAREPASHSSKCREKEREPYGGRSVEEDCSRRETSIARTN